MPVRPLHRQVLPVFLAADRDAHDLGRLTTPSAGTWRTIATLIYVEKGTWYLLVMSRCNYLTGDNRCGIYFNRPKICREYTTANCEYDSDWSFDKIFETPEQVWEYAEAILPSRRRPSMTEQGLPIVTVIG